MSKFKKVLLSAVVAILSFFMFGCSQIRLTTKYKITTDANGNQMPVITTRLEYSLEDFTDKTTVYKIIKDYFDDIEESYKKRLVELYDNIYRFELNGIINFTDKLNQIFINNNQFFTIEISKSEGISSEIQYVQMIFTSIYSYYMFFYPSAFEYNEEQNDIVIASDFHSLIDVPVAGNVDEINGTFVDKMIQTCNPFYYNGEEPKLLRNEFSYAKGESLEFVLRQYLKPSCDEQASFIFNFSTPYRRIHSDGNVSLVNGTYIHSWNLSTIDEPIKIWRNYANYVAWYVLAGLIGIVILLASFFVVFITNKIKKKNGMKLLKKINDFENKK